jgi:PilZ domain
MIPQDRRTTPRVDTGNLVVHSHVGAPSQTQALGLGVTLDLNEFGVRVQYASSFTVGDRYRFSIAIGDDLVEVVGRVAHVSQALNGTFEAGIEFLEVSERAVEVIRRHSRRARP